MAKKRRKFSYRTVRVIVTLVVFAIAVGYPAYQNYFASNRAINQWTDKQKIKPSSIGNITDNQLPKLAYEGQAIVQVNGGAPTFSDDDLKQNQGTWEKYGNLDKLGRATQANALVGQETMPTTDRSRLEYKPTGWKHYDAMIDGQVQSLYNRAHLIAYQLTAEEDNPKNLITSTRQLNDPAMEFYETETAWYIRKTGHHVRYQVTPVFVGDNLLANGVHMMARSIEDNGVSFNIYIFNVQPKVNIDYKTGLASGSIIQYNYDN